MSHDRWLCVDDRRQIKIVMCQRERDVVNYACIEHILYTPYASYIMVMARSHNMEIKVACVLTIAAINAKL